MAVFRWTDKGGSEVYLKFDAVTTVELSQETDISEHPVEVGPDVSDHFRARLPRISVTAFISNTPLYSNDGVDKLAEFEKIELPPVPRGKIPGTDVIFPNPQPPSLGQVVREGLTSATAPTKIFGLVFSDLKSRVREARDKLTEAQTGGYLISLSDADGDFDNLAISRSATIRALEDGNGATFQLEAQGIRLTTAQEVDAPEPAEQRGQAPQSKGSQSSKDDPNAVEKKEQLKSIAAGLYDGASSLF